MRRRLLVTSIVFVAIAAGGSKALVASTDCDRWIAEYKQALSQSRPVHRLISARHRLGVYVRPTRPKPRLVYSSAPHTPRLGPKEALRRFHILCGDLPGDNDVALLPPGPLPSFIPSVETPLPPDTTLVAMTPVPLAGGVPVPGSGPRPTTPLIPPAILLPPHSPGAPSLPIIPVISGGPHPPVTPGSPITPVMPVVPAPVPEPGTFLLLLTAVAAGVPVVRNARA